MLCQTLSTASLLISFELEVDGARNEEPNKQGKLEESMVTVNIEKRHPSLPLPCDNQRRDFLEVVKGQGICETLDQYFRWREEKKYGLV